MATQAPAQTRAQAGSDVAKKPVEQPKPADANRQAGGAKLVGGRLRRARSATTISYREHKMAQLTGTGSSSLAQGS